MNRMKYFAYGSNMCVEQMKEDRCPDAECLGVAELHDYRFKIMPRGYATIVPEEGAVVHRVLWAITPACEASLDRREGVRGGFYRKEMLQVVKSKDAAVTALVYIARETESGAPQRGYLEKIIAAAEAHRLPAAYCEELAVWGKTRA
jgi:gamma-glutamylcyclotransferase (GGCT)/AIG2-like uncharacterized protein YtfP